MESKPVYKIRKNGKQEVFEGTLEDVRKWLRQNSINSADEMRRAGYAVLELDEFWGLVSDFPELSMTERQGRGVLLAKMRKANWMVVGAVALALASITLFAYERWLPQIKLSLATSAYESQLADKDRLIKETATAKDKEAAASQEALQSEHKRQLEAKDAAIDELRSKLDQQKQSTGSEFAAKDKTLLDRATEIKKLKSEVDNLGDKLASADVNLAKMKLEKDQLESQLTKYKERRAKMPVTANLENRPIFGYALRVWNFSTSDYPVLVVISNPSNSNKNLSREYVINSIDGAKPGQLVITDNIEAGDTIVIKARSEEGVNSLMVSVPE